jgi:16S rRNA processing protein RimM
VLHLPAHDVLVIEREGREALVPFVAQHVPNVDVLGGHVTIADDAGLLEPLAASDPAAGTREA